MTTAFEIGYILGLQKSAADLPFHNPSVLAKLDAKHKKKQEQVGGTGLATNVVAGSTALGLSQMAPAPLQPLVNGAISKVLSEAQKKFNRIASGPSAEERRSLNESRDKDNSTEKRYGPQKHQNRVNK